MSKESAPPPPLARLLGLALGELTARLRERLIDAGYADQRPAHDAVFAHLPPEGLTLSDLARRAGISKQAMAELVADLESKGYVARGPDPTDRRARIITFTTRGWGAVEVALAAFVDLESELADRIGASRLAALRATLADIISVTTTDSGDDDPVPADRRQHVQPPLARGRIPRGGTDIGATRLDLRPGPDA